MRERSNTIRACIAGIFVFTTYALATQAYSAGFPGDPPTQLEIMKLPQFCLGTFQPKLAMKPEQNINNCGVFMNHYCVALVWMNRVKEPGRSKFDNQWLVGHARTEMDYTKKNMTPTCPIAQHVRDSDIRLRVQEQFVR